jgi:uncharacterized protein (TIGR04255 family)
MSRKKLKNAPLKEAIFELFWNSPINKAGLKVDREFELAIGKFSLNISKDFPVHKRTMPQEAPIKVYGLPLYQFWKGEIQWPVIQLGPGILTVNDTDKNYHWEDTYRPNISTAIEALTKSYSNLPNFNKVSLRYIDSVDVNKDEDILGFISKNLLTSIENKFSIPGKESAININQIFNIDDFKVSLQIQTAINNVTGNQAIVWITSVVRDGKIDVKELFLWIDKAHGIISDLFIKMLNPEFYESFDK